ncbi:low molecular weight protein-tyrosine-phosphatase [Vibrio europaeus]|uniref:low molecular weight protein-tyrosine-phosphatase n=1 Tax=Vibrio europaeus TaxID=300876 RepID=UPI0039E1A44A
MVKQILVVCSGNICRSPLAKELFTQALPKLKFDSAGVLVEKTGLKGKPAVGYSQTIAERKGLTLSEHKAKQVTSDLVEWSDLILVMSHDHIDLVSELNSGARGKTLLIGQWIGVGEVNDPLGKDIEEFEHCYRTLARAIESWRVRLG